MTKSLATAWVKALRSGKYKQGKGTLRANTNDLNPENPTHEHCCLGVLLEVCSKQKKFEPKVDVIQRTLRNDALLSESDMLDVVGLAYETEEFLTGSNDGMREDEVGTIKHIRSWSFGKIANWIEKKFVTGKKK